MSTAAPVDAVDAVVAVDAAPVVADDADDADDAVDAVDADDADVDDGESSNHVVQLDDVAVKSGVPKYNSFLFATMSVPTAFNGFVDFNEVDFNEVVASVAADVQAVADQFDAAFVVHVVVADRDDEILKVTQLLEESLAKNADLLAKNADLLAQNKALDKDNDDIRGDFALLSLKLKNAEKALKHERKRARRHNGSDDSSDESESGIQERIQKAIEAHDKFSREIYRDQLARDARKRRAVESASL
jgi:hypothetical protein